MGKALQGAAMIAGAAGLEFGAFLLDPALVATPLMNKLVTSLVIGGVSMEAGAVADALMQNRGMNITTRQPASFRQIVYGMQRIGGVIIYRSTTGSSHDQYNFIIVLATHEIAAIEALYLDGRRVYFEQTAPGGGALLSPDGTLFGGQANGTQYTGPNGQYYNFGGLVYCEARFGNQADGDVITGMTANDPTWAPDGSGNSPWVGGCAYVYLKVEYDANMFPGEPEIRFTVRGKNDVYDPRSSTSGYSENWALIVADVITDPTWGLGDNTVNQAQLIAAANVCDEQLTLANGSTESRYCCHWHYDTSTSPGNAIETMLSAAAGRISRIGGEWYLWPAYWQGPSLSFGIEDLAGEVQWQPNRAIAQLFNRVTGTYIAPNYPYNVAGDLYDTNGWYDGTIQNNFPFAFQPTNYPEYACDQLHGYGTGVDVYLTEDGGIVLPKEIAQPCVLSVAQAQRLAKINLLRNRQQGSGVLLMGMTALQIQPLDVIQFTFAQYGWTNKQLEIQGPFQWVVDHSGPEGAPRLYFKVPVGETDSSVYEWATTEELTVYDVPAAPLGVPYIVQPVTNLAIEDDSTTVMTLSDGTTVPRVLVSWTPPTDVYVNNGGKIEVQYQYATDASKPQPGILSPVLDTVTGVYNSAWVDAGAVSGDATFLFINGITPEQYQNINVRVRAVRANGATSAWLEVDNHPLQTKYPAWPIVGGGGSGPVLTFGPGGRDLAQLEPAGGTSPVPAPTTVSTQAGAALSDYVPLSSVPLPAALEYDVFLSGGIVDLFLYGGEGASGVNGYFARVDGRAGNPSAFLLVTNGAWSFIGTPGANNAAALTGWHKVQVVCRTNGTYELYVDGVLQATATDTTYTPTGAIYAGYEVTADPVIAPSGWTGKTQDYLPDGTSFKRVAAGAFAAGNDLFAYSAMSSEVQAAIEGGTGNVLNLGGTAAGSITPIADLMPAQAGADVTAQAGNVLLQNPSFERGSSYGWTIGSGTVNFASTGTVLDGTYSAAITGSGWFINNQKVPIAAGQQFAAAVWIYNAGASGGATEVGLHWFNSAGAQISYSSGNQVASGTAGWNQSRVVAVAPAGAASVSVFVQAGAVTSGVTYVDQTSASLYPSNIDEVPDGATYKRPLYISGGVYATSKAIRLQGSMANVSEGGDGSICSASVNNSQITVSWTAFDIYAPDGTVYSVPANSTGTTFTGLAASTTYYFAAWYNIATQLLTIALIGTAPGSLQYQIQTVQADGNVGVAVNFTFQTTSSTTTSTGSPTPPPNGTCFSPETLVLVKGVDGILHKPICRVERGDLVRTLAGSWRQVFYVSRTPYHGPMCQVGAAGRSTPTHLMWDGAKWVQAQDLYFDRVDYTGWMFNLHIDARSDEEHSYTLANGQVVHNIFTTS